jgi:hypothetical protein
MVAVVVSLWVVLATPVLDKTNLFTNTAEKPITKFLYRYCWQPCLKQKLLKQKEILWPLWTVTEISVT